MHEEFEGVVVPEPSSRFQCPFCDAYEVERLYLASTRLDSCECRSCGARWEEDVETGAYRGRADRTSTITPREP